MGFRYTYTLSVLLCLGRASLLLQYYAKLTAELAPASERTIMKVVSFI